ncbi:MAG: hypothetical protein LBS21_15840 [Clostridiales bacterium]|jgi:hypothetical protein|nr:hypothetical protein [Clostridiales bacterium]
MLNQYPTIKEFAFVLDKALNAFRAMTKNTGLNRYEIMEIISSEYISAASEERTPRFVLKKGTSAAAEMKDADKAYIISTINAATDGNKIVFLFGRNKRTGLQPWELQSVISETEYSDENYVNLGDNPKDMLWNFAYWTSTAVNLSLENLKKYLQKF